MSNYMQFLCRNIYINLIRSSAESEKSYQGDSSFLRKGLVTYRGET